jgi:3D (Asp-Asp-Asp) domain-containing protein
VHRRRDGREKLDLFLPSARDCLRFGVRQHEVRLLVQE